MYSSKAEQSLFKSIIESSNLSTPVLILCMPQLDLSTYSTQLFWLAFLFFCFYSFSFFQVVPSLARIFKVRTKKAFFSQKIQHVSFQLVTDFHSEFDSVLRCGSLHSFSLVSGVLLFSETWAYASKLKLPGFTITCTKAGSCFYSAFFIRSHSLSFIR